MGLERKHVLWPALHDRGAGTDLRFDFAPPARLSDRRGGSTPIRSAREILDERFAKGEIQREEYEERRQVLGA